MSFFFRKRSLRNFKVESKDRHNGFHVYDVGLLSHICFQRFSQGLLTRTWRHTVPRFFKLKQNN